MNSLKDIKCVNSLCGAAINHVNEGLVFCPKCSTNFILLCHQFPLTYHKNIKCTKCNNKCYYYSCQNCSNLVVNNNHRVGTPSSCGLCGDSGVFISCGVCYKPFKSDKPQNQEGKKIKCKICSGFFSYLTCQKCFQPIFSQKPIEAGEKLQCKNMKCRSEQISKACARCKGVYAGSMDSNQPHFCSQNIPVHHSLIQVKPKPSISIIEQKPSNKNMVQSKKETGAKKQTQKQENHCIICFDKPKACVNTTCFHLNVCQDCVPSDGKCPLCRVVGQYKKVFI